MEANFIVTANNQSQNKGAIVGVYSGKSQIRALLAAWAAKRKGATIVRLEWRP